MKNFEKLKLLLNLRIDLVIHKLENNEKLSFDDFIWFCIADYLNEDKKNNK